MDTSWDYIPELCSVRKSAKFLVTITSANNTTTCYRHFKTILPSLKIHIHNYSTQMHYLTQIIQHSRCKTQKAISTTKYAPLLKKPSKVHRKLGVRPHIMKIEKQNLENTVFYPTTQPCRGLECTSKITILFHTTINSLTSLNLCSCPLIF